MIKIQNILNITFIAVVVTVSQSECVHSCIGIIDGNYQSCTGCDVFVSCIGGVLYDNRLCPATLVWDDNKKNCLPISNSCV